MIGASAKPHPAARDGMVKVSTVLTRGCEIRSLILTVDAIVLICSLRISLLS